ncbi:MAG: hypothetical protein LCH26_00265 [Proteobacteria bacterium]|nr:hypothetical protein [Pseudomonadota bacterium]
MMSFVPMVRAYLHSAVYGEPLGSYAKYCLMPWQIAVGCTALYALLVSLVFAFHNADVWIHVLEFFVPAFALYCTCLIVLKIDGLEGKFHRRPDSNFFPLYIGAVPVTLGNLFPQILEHSWVLYVFHLLLAVSVLFQSSYWARAVKNLTLRPQGREMSRERFSLVVKTPRAMKIGFVKTVYVLGTKRGIYKYLCDVGIMVLVTFIGQSLAFVCKETHFFCESLNVPKSDLNFFLVTIVSYVYCFVSRIGAKGQAIQRIAPALIIRFLGSLLFVLFLEKIGFFEDCWWRMLYMIVLLAQIVSWFVPSLYQRGTNGFLKEGVHEEYKRAHFSGLALLSCFPIIFFFLQKNTLSSIELSAWYQNTLTWHTRLLVLIFMCGITVFLLKACFRAMAVYQGMVHAAARGGASGLSVPRLCSYDPLPGVSLP